MAGISSLGIAVSGMKAAQAGLYVTGHNVANVATPGYSRQMTLQNDFLTNTLGYNGKAPLQLGLGTDVSCIRQLRDKFMDQSYRNYSAKEAFYQVKYAAGNEIEAILNELEGEYKFQSILADLYNSIQELSKDPASMDTRANFIASCIAFISKADDTYNSLLSYQQTLNEAVKSQVQEVNSLVTEIKELNGRIAVGEAAGDHANDFRDKRNYALDRLSAILDITYKEQPDGSVDILAEGQELLVGGFAMQLGLRYTAPGYDFVEPVFTYSKEILNYDPSGLGNARPLFNLSKTISTAKGNDGGSLKGLLAARGTQPTDFTWGLATDHPLYADSPMDSDGVNYQLYNEFNINSQIPRAQMLIDTLVNSVVKLINDTFAGPDANGDRPYSPHAPYDQGVEIFSRKYPPFQNIDPATGQPIMYGDTAKNYIPESVRDPANPDTTGKYSLYSIGNIVVNPEILNPGGYYKIATATAIPDPGGSADKSDNKIILALLNTWGSEHGFITAQGGQPMSVSHFYRFVLTDLGETTNQAKSFVESQAQLLEEVGFFRDAMMGVSMDEELTNMMKYQHSYNAAARMVNVIDSMLDKIINGTGRVGL